MGSHFQEKTVHPAKRRAERIDSGPEVQRTPEEGTEQSTYAGDGLAVWMGRSEGADSGRSKGMHTFIQASSISAPVVQRAHRTDYPWEGIIVTRYSAALRSSAHKDPNNPHANTIADLRRGTRLTVIGKSGGWLNVRVNVDGTMREGYVSQELVDDIVIAEMENMMGDTANWQGFRNSGAAQTDFTLWARAPTETAPPALNSSVRLNCWEMILLAAYNAGAVPWSWIHSLYSTPYSEPAWMSIMSSSISPYVAGTTRLHRGELVYFNGLDHVAIATGSGEEVYSFWPPPDKGFDTSNPEWVTNDEIETTTISALITAINGLGFPTVNVEIGEPAW